MRCSRRASEGQDSGLRPNLRAPQSATSEALHLRSGELGPEQTFLEVWLPDDRVALQCYTGGFVSASTADGFGVPRYAGVIGDGEKFYYEKPPDELLPKKQEEVARPAESGPARPEASLGALSARPRLRDKILRPFGR